MVEERRSQHLVVVAELKVPVVTEDRSQVNPLDMKLFVLHGRQIVAMTLPMDSIATDLANRWRRYVFSMGHFPKVGKI